MLDALSLKNTRLALETLELMRIPDGAVRVVLNRADTKVGVSTDDAAHLLGRRPDVMVPSHRDITRSVNEASPIVASNGNSDARSAFLTLAAAFAPERAGASAGGRRSLLRFGKGS
jgi:pilus assembly protein CpaE